MSKAMYVLTQAEVILIRRALAEYAQSLEVAKNDASLKRLDVVWAPLRDEIYSINSLNSKLSQKPLVVGVP